MIVGWVTSMRSLKYLRRLIGHILRSFEQRFVEFTCQLRLECVGQIVFNRIGTTRSKRPVSTAKISIDNSARDWSKYGQMIDAS